MEPPAARLADGIAVGGSILSWHVDNTINRAGDLERRIRGGLVQASRCGVAPPERLTDYPVTEFGDTPNKTAPMRRCEVIRFDGDKYCQVKVFANYFEDKPSAVVEITRGYIYERVNPVTL